MSFRFLLLLYLVMLFSCHSNTIKKKDIIGKWTNGNSKGPSFEINEDSIIAFFEINNDSIITFERLGNYAYEIKRDTIEMFWETMNIFGYLSGTGKITLKQDTLIFHRT